MVKIPQSPFERLRVTIGCHAELVEACNLLDCGEVAEGFWLLLFLLLAQKKEAKKRAVLRKAPLRRTGHAPL